jgi:hypothetical protein
MGEEEKENISTKAPILMRAVNADGPLADANAMEILQENDDAATGTAPPSDALEEMSQGASKHARGAGESDTEDQSPSKRQKTGQFFIVLILMLSTKTVSEPGKKFRASFSRRACGCERVWQHSAGFG